MSKTIHMNKAIHTNKPADFYSALAVLTQFIELADKERPIELKPNEPKEEQNHGS